MNKITLKRAEEVVETQQRINYLTEQLEKYSVKRKGDGKRWSFDLVGDSRHFDAGYMLRQLPEEDQAAIDRYVITKFKKAIRDGKTRLQQLGVTE